MAPGFASPQISDPDGHDSGRGRLCSSDEVGTAEVEGEISAAASSSGATGGAIDVELGDVGESRGPRLALRPDRQTKKEIAEHIVTHWPVRSWCRHCVCGRAVGSPHKQRTEEDREFARGRNPTLSIDHCFLGTSADDEKAHGSPFLGIV